ncbi:hypothetical protein PSEMO_61940 [Pseudomonas putida]|uniref:Uncharacterized protein n=1 Tax=Pseudomonas putida TaxID=303 RepID=A0A1Q9QUJ9_PSEPU|nr:hypothetical protein PSEMO_61940 [Pseudomonas putida]
MNPDFLARQSGVSVHSVIDYQHLGRTHILRIDRDKEARRRQALKARAEAGSCEAIFTSGPGEVHPDGWPFSISPNSHSRNTSSATGASPGRLTST